MTEIGHALFIEPEPFQLLTEIDMNYENKGSSQTDDSTANLDSITGAPGARPIRTRLGAALGGLAHPNSNGRKRVILRAIRGNALAVDSVKVASTVVR